MMSYQRGVQNCSLSWTVLKLRYIFMEYQVVGGEDRGESGIPGHQLIASSPGSTHSPPYTLHVSFP